MKYNEQEFDQMLTESLLSPPPEDALVRVIPLKQAMNYVLIGMVLCTVLLNFAGLNYLLPTIGSILILLGYRSLRLGNRWLYGCFVMEIINVLTRILLLIIGTTIYQNEINILEAQKVLLAIGAISSYVQYFCLWRALCIVRKKASVKISLKSVVALFVFYVILGVFALMNYEGFLFLL
ncbi:hypothetical protein P261_02678 [Lachnospiraceae bacterium TWA4]|nr:hypothetical protein P261_02678 [Lachnospiraceae bacterium TWA4]